MLTVSSDRDEFEKTLEYFLTAWQRMRTEWALSALLHLRRSKIGVLKSLSKALQQMCCKMPSSVFVSAGNWCFHGCLLSYKTYHYTDSISPRVQQGGGGGRKQTENVTDLFTGIKSTLSRSKKGTQRQTARWPSVTEKGKKSWLDFQFI